MEIIEKIFAEVLIKSVPDIYVAVSSDLVSSKSRNIRTLPKIDEWLRRYRNSKLIFETTVIGLLSNIKDADAQVHNFCAFLDQQLKDIPSENIFNDISDHNLQFFIRVIVPCLLSYGQFPSIILRRARRGDEESIERLCRIDHSVIHDRKISQYLLNLSFRNPTRHKLLIRSITYEHKKQSTDEIKMNFAALISHVNKLFSMALHTPPMTYPQIRKLFVDEAKLHGIDDDIDLPSGDDAFSRRIRRNKMWCELFKVPDKN